MSNIENGGALMGPATKTTINGSTKTTSRYQTSRHQETILHELTDNGAGNFGNFGTANYAGKTINIRFVELDAKTDGYKSDYEDSAAFADNTGATSGDSKKGGEYADNAVSEQVLASSTVSVTYAMGFAGAIANQFGYAPPVVTIDLCPYTTDYIMPGSVRFTWMGHVFEDFEGVLYRDRTAESTGYVAGQINYSSGIAVITDYVVGGAVGSFSLDSLWTVRQKWTTAGIFFHVDAAPIRPGAGGFVLTCTDTLGNNLTANIDGQGAISGLHMRGRIEFSRGGVELQFGDYVLDADLTPEQMLEWWYSAADVGAVEAGKIWRPWPVDPSTLRYSSVSYIYLPVDVSLMGIDPAALPADGRVTFARPSDLCVIGVTHSAPAFAPMVGQVYAVGHERLSFVQVVDAGTGAEIQTGYTANLDAGTVTFTGLTGYPAQVRVIGRTEVYRQIAEVRIDGSIKLTQPIGYAFDTDAILSTALRQGDRFARVSRVYDQFSWSGTTWLDGLDVGIGVASATYNANGHPIEVDNLGAITERWALKIGAGGTTFTCTGQHLGQIASGNINEDFAPANMAAGAPYFTVRALGWGSGWVAGNTVFIDTVGAEFPIAVVRCTQPGSPIGASDSAWLVQRGDVGAPPESEF